MMDINSIFKIIEEYKKCENISEVARKLGIARNTVLKYIRQDYSKISVDKEKIARKGEYDDEILKLLEDNQKLVAINKKHKLTSTRIHMILSERHENFGLSKSTIARRVKVLRDKIKENSGCIAFLCLEHPPGEAQLDFGEILISIQGEETKAWMLIVSWPHSNAAYCQVYQAQNQECLFDGMQTIFRHVGGVPKKIRLDNMSTAVKRIFSGYEREMVEEFKRFSIHFGFSPEFCNVESGWEKGNVEAKVGYFRRNFFTPLIEVSSLENLNEKLLRQCEEDMNREHYEVGVKISELFLQDKQAMLEINPVDFVHFRVESVTSDKRGYVQFQGNTYSTSSIHARKVLFLRADATSVTIFDSDMREIITHERKYGKGHVSSVLLPYCEALAAKPRAMYRTAGLSTLPKEILDSIASLRFTERRDVLKDILGKLDAQKNCDVDSLFQCIPRYSTSFEKYQSLIPEKENEENSNNTDPI